MNNEQSLCPSPSQECVYCGGLINPNLFTVKWDGTENLFFHTGCIREYLGIKDRKVYQDDGA